MSMGQLEHELIYISYQICIYLCKNREVTPYEDRRAELQVQRKAAHG